MYNRLLIIGAGGHGKVAADIAMKMQKYDEIVFLDDNEETKDCIGFRVVGKVADARNYIEGSEVFVAMGNGETRKNLMEDLCEMGAKIATLVHPAAVIGSHVEIGKGTIVMAGAVLNPECTVGEGCIINTCASVDHDCRLGDYVHLAVGAHLGGTVEIGDATWIGAGVIAKHGVKICGDCMIGAGAVVVKDIKEPGTYVGVPAKKIKS